MSPYSRRSRLVIAVAIMFISMPLMGCYLYELFIDFANDGDFPAAKQEPAKQADAPTPNYDTEEPATTAGATDESVLFDNQNILAVQNGGTSPTFKVASTTTVTKIETYHWNDAGGNASTGKISLRGDDGKVYGPWETVGRPGQGDVPNAYWAASPNVTLSAGTYTVIDSDPSTWSQNADSGGEGFVVVHVEPQ